MPKAKDVSLIGQIFAALWIAGWSVAKFITDPSGATIMDIGLSGILVAACFTPVYFSIIMDKIKGIKLTKEG